MAEGLFLENSRVKNVHHEVTTISVILLASDLVHYVFEVNYVRPNKQRCDWPQEDIPSYLYFADSSQTTEDGDVQRETLPPKRLLD